MFPNILFCFFFQVNGLPNEIISNLNPLSLMIMIPLFDLIFYPFLRKIGINFTPLKRMFFGFMFGALAMVWAAGEWQACKIVEEQVARTSLSSTLIFRFFSLFPLIRKSCNTTSIKSLLVETTLEVLSLDLMEKMSLVNQP